MEERSDAAIPTNHVNDTENRTLFFFLKSLKYILKKEGFYNNFVVLKKGYRKIKKDLLILLPGDK